MALFNLLLTLVFPIFLVSCSSLAEGIDQVREMVNLENYRTADQNTKRNGARAPEKQEENKQIISREQSSPANTPTKKSIQMVPHEQGKNVGTLNTAASLDEKCHILLEWVSQLKREYPEVYKEKTRKRGPLESRRIPKWSNYSNLFRDKYFVPVFGISYLQMDKPTRSTFYKNMQGKNGCLHSSRYRQISPFEIINDFAPYQDMLAVAFGNGIPPYSIESNQSEEDRMEEGLTKIKNFPSTAKSFKQLLAEVNRNTNPTEGNPILEWEINHLWPSEINAFHETLKQKLHKVALSLADERLKKLAAIPNTWEGLGESQSWQKEFQEDFSDFGEFSEKELANAAFAKKREEIFQSIKAEFKVKLNALQPPTPDNLTKANDLLQSIFLLTEDQSLPSYVQYKGLVQDYQASGLSSIVATFLDDLEKIPQNLSGARKLIELENAFHKEVSQFRDHPLVLKTY